MFFRCWLIDMNGIQPVKTPAPTIHRIFLSGGMYWISAPTPAIFGKSAQIWLRPKFWPNLAGFKHLCTRLTRQLLTAKSNGISDGMSSLE